MKENTSRQSSWVRESFTLKTSFGHECQGVHYAPDSPAQNALIYAIGWGTDTNIHAPTMEAFVSSGYDVWSVTPPRFGDTQPTTEHMLPTVEVHKAAAVVGLLEKLGAEGITETDIVLHSEGAIYASIAVLLAANNPNTAKVRSIIYVEPAGFVGKEHPLLLTTRFARQAAKNVLKDVEFYLNARRSAKGMLRPRVSLYEASAIAQTDISLLLTRLHNEFGVKIGVMSGQYDGVFPQSRIEQTLQTLTIPYVYKSLPIRHNGMYVQSELVASQVQKMLGELNA